MAWTDQVKALSSFVASFHGTEEAYYKPWGGDWGEDPIPVQSEGDRVDAGGIVLETPAKTIFVSRAFVPDVTEGKDKFRFPSEQVDGQALPEYFVSGVVGSGPGHYILALGR